MFYSRYWANRKSKDYSIAYWAKIRLIMEGGDQSLADLIKSTEEEF
jgi:hypothetical protein